MTVTRHPNNQGVTLSQWRYNATGGETTLSGTDAFGAGLSYTVGAEQVFVNGVLLERGVDYTASTGTTVTGLTALVAGDIVTVSSPSAFNVANAIPKATVAAKGDLIVGNGAASVTNLGVGSDGTTLVANSSSATGVAWAGPSVAAGKNAVINGAFDYFQRGTSGTVGGSVSYTADRWQSLTYSGGTMSWSQVATSNTPVGSKYALRVQRAASATNTATMNISYAAETSESLKFAGQTFTLSFWARAGANFSASSNALNVQVHTGTGTDQSIYGTGFTGDGTPVNTTATLTTSWQKFTFSGTASSSTNQVGVVFYFVPTGTAGAADYFDFTLVQLELGSVATAFSRAGGTLQGELAACQRYYYRIDSGAQTYAWFANGQASSTTQYYLQMPLKTTFRVTPTAVDYSTLRVQSYSGVYNAISALTIYGAATNTVTLQATTTGLTTGNYYDCTGNGSTSAFIGLSAEL